MAKSATRAFVYPVKEEAAVIEKLKRLIAAAGCELVSNQGHLVDPKKCLQEADVLVVLICSQTMNDSAVNELMLVASRTGKRVVGVWAPGTKDGKLPPGLNKYGDATIVFDQKAIEDTVCGGVSGWSTPEGNPRAKPKTPRHKK